MECEPFIVKISQKELKEIKEKYMKYEELSLFYELAKNGEFEELEDDYYGLIEIKSDLGVIHGIAPKTSLWSNYIGKFDYIYSRWRVYGWKKDGKPLEEDDYKKLALAVWKASSVSESAKKYIKESWFIRTYLLKN